MIDCHSNDLQAGGDCVYEALKSFSFFREPVNSRRAESAKGELAASPHRENGKNSHRKKKEITDLPNHWFIPSPVYIEVNILSHHHY